MTDDLGLEDDEQSKDVELAPGAELARRRLLHAQEQAATARNLLEQFTANVPSGRDIQAMGAMIVVDVINRVATGDLPFKNADDATKSAERIVKMLREMDLVDVGKELEDVPPDERKALLAELKAKAKALKS